MPATTHNSRCSLCGVRPEEVRVCHVPGCAMVTVERIDLEWLLRRWGDLAQELDMRENIPEPVQCPSCRKDFTTHATVLDSENADDRRTVARLSHALGLMPR